MWIFQNTFASTETQRHVKPLRMLDEVCFEMVTIKQTRLNKSFFRLKGVPHDVVLNFDKKRAFFLVMSRKIKNQNLSGFAMIVKAGRADLVTADTAQDELTCLG